MTTAQLSAHDFWLGATTWTARLGRQDQDHGKRRREVSDPYQLPLARQLAGRVETDLPYFLTTANTVVMPERLTFDGAVTFRHRAYDVALNFVNLTDRERYYVSQIHSGRPVGWRETTESR